LRAVAIWQGNLRILPFLPGMAAPRIIRWLPVSFGVPGFLLASFYIGFMPGKRQAWQ